MEKKKFCQKIKKKSYILNPNYETVEMIPKSNELRTMYAVGHHPVPRQVRG